MDPKQITDLLVQGGSLSAQVAQNLVADARLNSRRIDSLIIEQQLLTQEGFYHALSEGLGIDYYDILNFQPTVETLQLIPLRLVRQHGILPLFTTGGTVFIALIDPFNSEAWDSLRFVLGSNFQQVLADVDRVRSLIHSCYSTETEVSADKISPPKKTKYFDSTTTPTTEPITQFVDLILEKAIQSRASDIHLEPFEAEFKIRYRVDGMLYEMISPPFHLASAIISYIKVLAHLNIAEHRLPQDGRIQYLISGRPVDLRVSILPTAFGESTVLRVLDRSMVQLDLEMLGMPDEIFRSVMETIQKPNGIFIITGPTGSGKTTTLYSCLRKVNTVNSKLLTVEDPVEYEIDGVLQVPVNENIDLSFSKVLRAFLRQDPDCIMVGEIRDMETAQIAIQASLTGHLVFTTLHTNDTIGAITRLENLGIEPFLISASLEGILAQRLIRQLCPHCRVEYQPAETTPAEYRKSYYGAGCEICNHTGYVGRKGVYEFLTITHPIRELINHRSSEILFRKKAQELGMVTLREQGLRSVFAGNSSLEEIMKYT